MNVLSLFDGMSCGRIALERAGIPVANYFASEIDKHAIAVSKKNWPDICNCGDITTMHGVYINPKPDLLIGGSPCQGFSRAGQLLNFDDPRSKLFFQFVRLLDETNPKYFFLENVNMKKEWQDVISSYLGVEPLMINAGLLSAQNRKRLYWTNIPNITQPSDCGLNLVDILEDTASESYLLNKNQVKRGIYQAEAKTWKSGNKMGKMDFPNNINKKVKTLTTVASNGGRETNHIRCNRIGTAIDINGKDCLKRIYDVNYKSPTLTAICGGNQHVKIAEDEIHYRILTPIEYERLQGLPDNYTSGVSTSQRYRMCGNGWECNTIAHIFKNIPH